MKLQKQILPILERHLAEEGQQRENSAESHFRSFVVVCYAKTIRKLKTSVFNTLLHKLINAVVVHGLRARELSYREKARKALARLIEEVSPRFLSAVFEEMRSQLTRGFQQHVYLFSLHNLLQGLVASDSLKETGCITIETIQKNMAVLLSELFGDLNEEKAND